MKKYENYEAEDFALDGDFRDWVQGKSPQADFWFAFVQQHPELHEAIRTAEELVRAMRVPTDPVAEKLVRTEVHRFREKALQTPPIARSARMSWGHPFSYRNIYRYAAVIGLLGLVLAGGWWVGNTYEKGASPPAAGGLEASGIAYTETRNATEKPLRLVLSDGSVVLLGPRSVLRYAPQFSDKERVVYLTGEGQFEVVKRKEPFKVYAGDLVTRVLGTRFSIRAYQGDTKVTVQVQSGKVSVLQKYSDEKMNETDKVGIILLPNQAAIYNQTEGQLSKTIVENPLIQVPEASGVHFEYQEVPLSRVLHQIQQAYAIPIQFDEEALQDCRITASLTHETMIEKVAILCKLVGGQYEIVDGQIIVRADGCR